MKERLEYLEGKLGDSADKHSKAASGCAVIPDVTDFSPSLHPPSQSDKELSTMEAKMQELSGP